MIEENTPVLRREANPVFFWRPSKEDRPIKIVSYRNPLDNLDYHSTFLGVAKMHVPCYGFNRCPICDLLTTENRRTEFLESVKGFWTE